MTPRRFSVEVPERFLRLFRCVAVSFTALQDKWEDTGLVLLIWRITLAQHDRIKRAARLDTHGCLACHKRRFYWIIGVGLASGSFNG